MSGLMCLVRSMCYDNILNFENFVMRCDIDDTIRLYILVLKQGYGNDFNNTHVQFTLDQFEKLLNANSDHNIKTKDNDGNSYLHEVCCETMWGHPFCVELFEYFLSKGLNPNDKNNEGKTCVDLINEQYVEQARKLVKN